MDNSTDFIKVEHDLEEMETRNSEDDINISELCRVCAKMCTSEATDLFPATEEITASLECLFQIKLEEGDGLPTRLCSTCEDEIVHYNQLCQQVQQAQQFLKSHAVSSQDPLAMPSTEGEQQNTEDTGDLQDTKPILTEVEANQDLHNILMSLNSTVKSEPVDTEDNSVTVFNSENRDVSVNMVHQDVNFTAVNSNTMPQSTNFSTENNDSSVNMLSQSINFNPVNSQVNIMPAQFGTVNSEPLIVNLALMPSFVPPGQAASNITPHPHFSHHNSQPVAQSSSEPAPIPHSSHLPRLAPKAIDSVPLVHIDPSIHFQCGLCKTNFGSQLQLKMHLNLEINMRKKKLLPCAHCTRQFKKVNLLLVHLMRHIRNSSVQDFTCEICNRSFKDNYSHRNHLISHWEHRAFRCKLCGECFKHRVTWYSHCQRKHQQANNQLLEIIPKPEEQQESVPAVIHIGPQLVQAKMSQFIPIQPKTSQ